jgi:hypothetical protein
MATARSTSITTPLKNRDPGDEVTVVHRWENGLTWMAHPEPQMQRASHALVHDDDVWVVDPLDAAGLDKELDALGTVAGIVVIDSQHERHADRLADRHDVAIHVPTCLPEDSHPVRGFDAPVEFFDEELADTGFELVWEKVSEPVRWYEGALYHPERGTLVIPDTLMTAHLTVQIGRLEVVPFWRFSPPTELGELPVERILVGHGKPVTDDAQTALEAALTGDRGSATGALVRALLRSLPKFPRYVYRDLRN